jgi:hypothetical protein
MTGADFESEWRKVRPSPGVRRVCLTRDGTSHCAAAITSDMMLDAARALVGEYRVCERRLCARHADAGRVEAGSLTPAAAPALDTLARRRSDRTRGVYAPACGRILAGWEASAEQKVFIVFGLSAA